MRSDEMTTLFPNERAMVGCKLMSVMLFTYTITNSCRYGAQNEKYIGENWKCL